MDLRRNFSSSGLVRLLGDSTLMEVEASRQDFAERLSQWVDAFDAVTLHAAHQSLKTEAAGKASNVRSAPPLAVEAEFHRVRTTLVKAITSNGTARDGGKHARPPARQPEAVPEKEAGYGTYHQRYLEQQRLMESQLGPLRAQVRQSLSAASPRLRQLAALDAVLEQMLGGREQKLLSRVPVLLERRFEHLRQTHPGGPGTAPQDDTPVAHTPGEWQDLFGKELQDILLAELDVRLQPVMGLMEALRNEAGQYQ